MRGTLPHKIQDLHTRYGSVVRTGPNELSYIDEAAWEDIHGKHNGGKQLAKADEFMPTKPPNGAQGLVFVRDDADHGRLRRNFSHGFSDKALRGQENLIGKYFDALTWRVGEACKAKKPLDMTKWYQLTTFDIVGDLTFGESFNCLQDDHELHVSNSLMNCSAHPHEALLTRRNHSATEMGQESLLHCQVSVHTRLSPPLDVD